MPVINRDLKNKSFLFIILIFILFENQYSKSLEVNKNKYNQKDFIMFLSKKICLNCNLKSIDLVNSDLRNSILRGSYLEKANLSGSNLDGSDLRNTDLSFTTLSSSSLRNVDLRGAILKRTDLRNADLTGAFLDYGALRRSYWNNAKGININYQSFEEIYNAGIDKYKSYKFREAELLFTKGIQKNQYKAKTLIARAASRIKQDKVISAIEDLNLASEVYSSKGEYKNSEIVKIASEEIEREHERGIRDARINSKIQHIIKAFTIMRMVSPVIP